ncbi:hypothetical protein ES703_28621 [subsurface metagenome]
MSNCPEFVKSLPWNEESQHEVVESPTGFLFFARTFKAVKSQIERVLLPSFYILTKALGICQVLFAG